MRIETVMIDADDGPRVQADLCRVETPIGAVVLTHPHPLYGGNRFNPIIDTLFRLLPAAGFDTVRFDFRGVGASTGDHDEGNGERLDVLAAIDLLGPEQIDATVWLVGYSFGSIVSLNVVDPRVRGWIAIAPPLAASGPCAAHDDPRPKLLMCPQRDQFSPPETVVPMVAGWADTELRVIASADHFLGGAVPSIAADVVAHLTQRRR